jgi:hypothetical protein
MVFEEKQVFPANFRLKRQIGKKLEAIGLIVAQSRLERTCALAHQHLITYQAGPSAAYVRAPNTRIDCRSAIECTDM